MSTGVAAEPLEAQLQPWGAKRRGAVSPGRTFSPPGAHLGAGCRLGPGLLALCRWNKVAFSKKLYFRNVPPSPTRQEVGAGTGYWARLLAARGADVLATDLAPPGKEGTDLLHNLAGGSNMFHTESLFAVRRQARVDGGLRGIDPAYGSAAIQRSAKAAFPFGAAERG